MASAQESLLSPQFLARLERMELVSRKIFRGRMKGERRSPRKGQSVEFADFRSYVPGDDLRFIDWNTYARLERLFLKMFLEEEDLHLYLLLDTSGSMGFGNPNKLEYAKRVAAALGFIGLVRSDRVKIETLGQSDRKSSDALRGRRSLWRMMQMLDEIQPAGPTQLASGIKSFCMRNSGKGIVVLISDLMDKSGYEEGLRYLTAQRMDTYIIHVLSPEELDPDLKGDLQLVDCEDDDRADITISAPLLKKYKQTLDAFVSSARDFCNKRGMVYVLSSTQAPFEQLITGYLQRRGLLR